MPLGGLAMSLIKYKLGELLESSDVRNKDRNNQYTAEDVKGISTNKEFIETKANLEGVSLNSYRVVDPEEFAYVADTSRRGDKISLAFNDTDNAIIVSSISTIFRVKRMDLLDPHYLFMYFNRPEFDRFSRFNSWGSARETFSWEDLCDVEIELPSIEIQKKYAEVYIALLDNQNAYEKGLEDLRVSYNLVIDDLKYTSTRVPVGELCVEVDERNETLGIKTISGVDIEKKLFPSNANVKESALKNYKVLKPNYFVFSGMQTGRDKTIRIALNNTNENHIVSPAYTVLKTFEDKVTPEYFMLWFSREETDRYGWFISDASIRSNLDLERFFEIEIPLPTIKIQKAVADIYTCYVERTQINNKLKDRIKTMCPILIKGAIEEASREEV